ncbi:MAG: histidinol-phosphate transaminase [Terriglobia bacterium]
MAPIALQVRPRKSVAKLPQYHPPLEGRAGKLRLDFNENTIGCAPAVVRALRRTLNADRLSRYPEYEEAREILAKYFGVSADELLMTNGIDDAIKLICDTFVDPGDELVIPAPTFSMYQFFQAVAAGKTRLVPYDHQMRLPATRLIKAVTRRTRWMALANPNNPTGTLIPKGDLRDILRAAPKVAVLVDEAYFDFSGETVLPWIHEFSNLIVARTFSKGFGLAGVRLGVLIANVELIGLMRRAHAVFPVNSFALVGALEAIRHEEYVRHYAATVRVNRELLCARLEEMGVAYLPSAANFVFVRVGDRAPEIAQHLREQDILVRDWGHDPHLRRYLRLTIGNAPQTRRLTRQFELLRPVIDTGDVASAWRDLIDYSPKERFV